MRKGIIIAIIAITFMVCVYAITFLNQANYTVKVNQVDKMERLSGNRDKFDTDIYYLVYTDKGTFRINISGLVAHPELAGAMEKDSIYDITVCGIEVPFLGMYRNIINAR